MKNETLQALRLDQSLGELSPEVSELLQAYLAQNPHEAAAASHLAATAEEAKRAVRIHPCSTGSTLPAPRWLEAESSVHGRWSFAPRWFGLAASFLLVAGVAWQAGVKFNNPSKVPITIASSSSEATPLSASTRSLSDSASIPPSRSTVVRPQRYRLVWQSPLKVPQIEETP